MKSVIHNGGTMTDHAWEIGCPTCKAPVGVNCVSIIWEPRDGKFIPKLVERVEHHAKRVRRFEKFRYDGRDDE